MPEITGFGSKNRLVFKVEKRFPPVSLVEHLGYFRCIFGRLLL